MSGNPVSDAMQIFKAVGGSKKKVSPLGVNDTSLTGPVKTPQLSDTSGQVDMELERLKRQQGRAATILQGSGDDMTLGAPKKRNLLGGGY
jgi:hypothetical protein